MFSLEMIGLGMASLLALVGTLFMVMCRKVWLDFFQTSAFKDVTVLQSDEVLPLLGALVSNFLFIAGACIFSIGMMAISLLIGVNAGLVALAGVIPFASIFLIMRILKQSPIGIPFEHLSPPAPAVIVIVGSSLVLLASAVTGIQAGTVALSVPYGILLVVAVLVPNLIAMRHRRAGWLNQPKFENTSD